MGEVILPCYLYSQQVVSEQSTCMPCMCHWARGFLKASERRWLEQHQPLKPLWALWRNASGSRTQYYGSVSECLLGIMSSEWRHTSSMLLGLLSFSSEIKTLSSNNTTTQEKETWPARVAVVFRSEQVSLFLFRCSLTHNFDRDRQLGFCKPKNTQPNGEFMIKLLLYWNEAVLFSTLFFLYHVIGFVFVISFCPHIAQSQWCVSAQPLSQRRSLRPGPSQLLHTVLLSSELHWQPLPAQWVHFLRTPPNYMTNCFYYFIPGLF